MGNIQTIQQMYADFGRGDIPAILSRLSEDVEWEYGNVMTDVPWLQKRQGRQAVNGFFESMAAFDLTRFEPRTFLENDNLVVVLIDLELTVKATGIRVVEPDEVHLWYFDDEGMVTRFAHRMDTHAHWLAYHGKEGAANSASAS